MLLSLLHQSLNFGEQNFGLSAQFPLVVIPSSGPSFGHRPPELLSLLTFRVPLAH